MLTIRPSLVADLAAIATIASHAPVGVTSARRQCPVIRT